METIGDLMTVASQVGPCILIPILALMVFVIWLFLPIRHDAPGRSQISPRFFLVIAILVIGMVVPVVISMLAYKP